MVRCDHADKCYKKDCNHAKGHERNGTCTTYFCSDVNTYVKCVGIDMRPSWDEYFMDICRTTAKRSTCDRGRVGCVIVRDHQILCTGYAGSPHGFEHCDDVGHEFKETIHEDGSRSQHCIRTVHAEQNAIVQAARRGIAIDGATVYCTMTPCRTCAMLLINAGIKAVVCDYHYHAEADSMHMLNIAFINIKHFHEGDMVYENKM